MKSHHAAAAGLRQFDPRRADDLDPEDDTSLRALIASHATGRESRSRYVPEADRPTPAPTPTIEPAGDPAIGAREGRAWAKLRDALRDYLRDYMTQAASAKPLIVRGFPPLRPDHSVMQAIETIATLRPSRILPADALPIWAKLRDETHKARPSAFHAVMPEARKPKAIQTEPAIVEAATQLREIAAAYAAKAPKPKPGRIDADTSRRLGAIGEAREAISRRGDDPSNRAIAHWIAQHRPAAFTYKGRAMTEEGIRNAIPTTIGNVGTRGGVVGTK